MNGMHSGDQLLSIVLIARQSTSFYLARALQSALDQTYANKEILILDANAPGSRHQQGLMEDMKRHPQLPVLRCGADASLSACKNEALKRTRGAYVAFLEGEDVWDPGKAVLQIDLLMADESAALCCTNGIMSCARVRAVTSDVIFDRPSYDAQRWLLERPIRASSQVVYRAEALRAIGGFDEALDCLGDLDAAMRLAQDHRIAFLMEPMFTAHVTAEDDREAREYADGQYLLRKYADLLLLNRKTAHHYCLLMARKAAANRLYFHMLGYVLLSILKAPAYAALALPRAGLRKAARGLRIALWHGRARAAGARLLCALRMWGGHPFAAKERPANGRRPETAREGSWRVARQARAFAKYGPFHWARAQTGARVVIPEGIAVLRAGMFYGCEALSSVEIPRSVVRIEAHAFQNCRRLEAVYFRPGSKLASIGAYAFAGCLHLRALQLPGGLERIGRGAFAGCAGLETIASHCFEDGARVVRKALPATLRVLAGYAFAGCARLAAVRFDEGSMLRVVADGVFLGCGALESALLNGEIERIGARAFQGCERFVQLEMPRIDAVRQLGRAAFAHCRSLREIVVPRALTRIPPRAYFGCAALVHVEVPAGVLRIGRQAFAKCEALRDVMLLNPATSYPASAFARGAHIRAFDPSVEEES